MLSNSSVSASARISAVWEFDRCPPLPEILLLSDSGYGPAISRLLS